MKLFWLLLPALLSGQTPGGMYADFAHPRPEFSITPLFRLNDKVDRGEVRWQFEQMKRAGIHAFFLQPERLTGAFGWKDAGMPYDYLSPAYFDAVSAIAEESKRAGMRLWVYDEVDWPSGAAGGKIQANPEYRARAITENLTGYEGPRKIVIPAGNDVFAVSAWRSEGGRIDPKGMQNLTGRREWDAPAGHWQVATYRLEPNPGLYGNTDSDLMNAQAMKEFIDLTHRQYKERFEDKLGVKIHGTFTDEPHAPSYRNYVGDIRECRYLPWTPAFAAGFRQRKGYDIRARLPLLYHDGGPQTAKVRCDFWETASHMFVENYFGQIAAFDHKAGWIHTGHLNGEESFWWHLVFDAGDEFAVQSKFDYPGLDWIFPFDYTPDLGIGWLKPFAPKFVSSAAHVYGKPRVMEETFAGAGNGLPFYDMRRMVNWAFVHGVDMIVPITYKYSLRGADRATSYPGISYQQPWWSEMGPFSDYVSRLGYILSQGDYQANIAYLLPTADVWANCQDREYVDTLTRKTYWANDAMMKGGYGFDYIDDASIQRAEIRNGAFKVGRNRYEILIVPPVRVVNLETLEKIAAFSRAGGKVIGLDAWPRGSSQNGDPDAKVPALVQSLSGAKLAVLDESAAGFLRVLNSLTATPLTLRGSADGVFYQHRKAGGRDLYFLINSTAQDREFDTVFRDGGAYELWDPDTGQRYSLARPHLLLHAYDSAVLVSNSGLPAAPARFWWTRPVSVFDITGQWNFTLHPTMDQPHLAWNFTPVPAAWQPKPTDYSGIHQITAGNWAERGLPYYSGQAIYEKEIDFPAPVEGRRYQLDLGSVGVSARVWLNGQPLGLRLWKPYTFDVTGSLKPGRNTIRVLVANTLANYYSQFEALKDKPLYAGGSLPWMLPSGLMGPVAIRGYEE